MTDEELIIKLRESGIIRPQNVPIIEGGATGIEVLNENKTSEDLVKFIRKLQTDND